MTATLNRPTTRAVDAEPIQPRMLRILDELDQVVLERREVIRTLLVGLISQQHTLLLGPGGTGKTYLLNQLFRHLTDVRIFATMLLEGSTPDDLFGPQSVRGIVEDDVYRRNTSGMLPEAHLAFVDEVYNGNQPTLHGLHSVMNERVFHNGGVIVNSPLKSMVGGTNLINFDQAFAAFHDRWHFRHSLESLTDRENVRQMLRGSLTRRQASTVGLPEEPVTTVSLAELAEGTRQAYELPVPDAVLDTFLDLCEGLARTGVTVSDRRKNDALNAVVANAWLQGHDEVRIGDLTILQHMLWTKLEDEAPVRNVILTVCNPGEKQALDLAAQLDQLVADLDDATKLDQAKKHATAMSLAGKAKNIVQAAERLHETAVASGATTDRIDSVRKNGDTLVMRIGRDLFGFSEAEAAIAMGNLLKR